VTTPGRGAETGDDGLARCPWALSTADLLAYHDAEWGKPVHGDEAMFERLCLEAFQSGLSWLTILRKRAAFRAAFAGFDLAKIAAFGAQDSDDRAAPVTLADVPAWTPASKALSRELKRAGFTFTGPVTAYAAMQATGVVNDHLQGCAFRG
jgi:DNA-3-methyladenine glycosylase I